MNLTLKNLLAYLAFSLSCLTTFSQAAEWPALAGDSTSPGVYYKDISPDLELSFTNLAADTIRLDLNNDNVDDLYILQDIASGPYSARHFLEIGPLGTAEFYSAVDANVHPGTHYPVGIWSGWVLDSSLTWSSDPTFLFKFYSQAPDIFKEINYWEGLIGQRFIGFRIPTPNATYYGWIRARVEQRGSHSDYAAIFESWGITTGATTSIADHNLLEGIKCGPVPTNGVLYLQKNNPKIARTEFSLYGANQAILKKWTMDTGRERMSVDLSELPNGLYFLVGQSGAMSKTWKVLKN